jgi:DNA-binding protein HU-beta
MATAAKKTAAVKVETVSTRQLAGQLAEKHELSQKLANTMLEDIIALVTKHLKKGARIRLNGLGILVVRKRGPRMGRNPATGEAIKIKASKKVAFRASKEMKKGRVFCTRPFLISYIALPLRICPHIWRGDVSACPMAPKRLGSLPDFKREFHHGAQENRSYRRRTDRWYLGPSGRS